MLIIVLLAKVTISLLISCAISAKRDLFGIPKETIVLLVHKNATSVILMVTVLSVVLKKTSEF